MKSFVHMGLKVVSVVEHQYDWGMSTEGCLEEIVSFDDLVASLGHLERFGAKVALAAAQLNVSGMWAADGAVTMGGWLKQHARLSHRDARRLLKEGTFLNTFDDVATAAVSGVLSASQVTAMRAVVSKPTADLFGEQQQAVIEAITPLPAQAAEMVCQAWRAKAEAIVDMPEPKHRDRSWSTTQLPDGSVFGKFAFDRTAAEILETALETARCWDGAADTRTPSMRNADAIVEILGFFNHNNNSNATPRHHPHIELVIELQPGSNPHVPGDPETGEPGGTDDARSAGEQTGTGDDGSASKPLNIFGPTHGGNGDSCGNGGGGDGDGSEHLGLGGCAVTANGRILDSWATDAFLCDCVLHKVLRTSAGKVLDYGRSYHSVPPRLWKAVAIRDRGCRFPGCNRKKAWTDAHHITWWRRHGETKLDNLLLLCQRHHHMVHKHDWHINLDADTGRATFTLPNGRILISEPPGQPTIRAA